MRYENGHNLFIMFHDYSFIIQSHYQSMSTDLNHDDNMDLDNNLLMDPDMDMDCSVPMTRYVCMHVLFSV